MIRVKIFYIVFFCKKKKKGGNIFEIYVLNEINYLLKW